MTNKTIEEADQYVALFGATGGGGGGGYDVLSLRRRSDLDKELITLKISFGEYHGTKFCS